MIPIFQISIKHAKADIVVYLCLFAHGRSFVLAEEKDEECAVDLVL